jgi:hypothetical protein
VTLFVAAAYISDDDVLVLTVIETCRRSGVANVGYFVNLHHTTHIIHHLYTHQSSFVLTLLLSNNMHSFILTMVVMPSIFCLITITAFLGAVGAVEIAETLSNVDILTGQQSSEVIITCTPTPVIGASYDAQLMSSNTSIVNPDDVRITSMVAWAPPSEFIQSNAYTVPVSSITGSTQLTIACIDGNGERATRSYTYTVHPGVTIDTNEPLAFTAYQGQVTPIVDSGAHLVTCHGGMTAVNGINNYTMLVTSGPLVAARVSSNQFSVTFVGPWNQGIGATTSHSLTCIDNTAGYLVASASLSYEVTIYPKLTITGVPTSVAVGINQLPNTFTLVCSGGSGYLNQLVTYQPSSINGSEIYITSGSSGTYMVQLPMLVSPLTSTPIKFRCKDQSANGAIPDAVVTLNYIVNPFPMLDLTAIDNIHIAAGNDLPLIIVKCSLGTEPYTITSTFGTINPDNTLTLPRYDTTGFSMTTIDVTCVDHENVTAVTTFTYTVNPPLTISSELTNNQFIGHVGDIDPPAIAIRCGGGSDTAYSLHVSPMEISFVGSSDSGLITILEGYGVDDLGDNGRLWTVELPTSPFLRLAPTTITIWCNDSYPFATFANPAVYKMNYSIILESEAETVQSIILSALNGATGGTPQMMTTRNAKPPSFSVNCEGDYGIAALLVISSSINWIASQATITTLAIPNIFAVQLPQVDDDVKLATLILTCEGSDPNTTSPSAQLEYIINEAPSTPTISPSSTVVVINDATPSTIEVACPNGGTGALTPSIIISSVDSNTVITNSDIQYTISNGTLFLSLPSKTTSTSATLYARCTDSLGVTSQSSINWCIGSSYQRCASSCSAITSTEWSTCTSACNSGVQFRVCTNTVTGTMGVSNRVCNTQSCDTIITSVAFRLRLSVSVSMATEASFQSSLLNELATEAQINVKRFSIMSISNVDVIQKTSISGTFVVVNISDDATSTTSAGEAMTTLALGFMNSNTAIHRSSSVAALSIDYTSPIEPWTPVEDPRYGDILSSSFGGFLVLNFFCFLVTK